MEFIAAGLYIAIAVALVPSLARRFWEMEKREWPRTASRKEAVVLAMIGAVVWPGLLIGWSFSTVAGDLERRIFKP